MIMTGDGIDGEATLGDIQFAAQMPG